MKPLLRNPFLTRPIKWGEPFCNREKELQTLIREAENSGLVVLYGPRRCGKTSESLGKIGLAQSSIALSLKALDEKGFLTKVPEIGHDRYIVTDIIDKLCLRILSGVSVDEMTDHVILAARSS